MLNPGARIARRVPRAPEPPDPAAAREPKRLAAQQRLDVFGVLDFGVEGLGSWVWDVGF